MAATQYVIVSKHRRTRAYTASLHDFTLGEGQPFPGNQVITNHALSLYCLDDENRRAVFVELPADVDLTKAPFVYYTQYEHARRIVTVPYEAFISLGDALPSVQRPIMIYMLGRSGSTLLSHILNESGAVVSLSEPDVGTQFTHFWSGSEGSRDDELRQLASSAARFLFRQYPTDDGKAHAIKLRFEGLRVMDLFQAALPGVRNLFSYRDPLGFINSFTRLMLKLGSPGVRPLGEQLHRAQERSQMDWSHLVVYLDDGQQDITEPEFLTLWYIFCYELYRSQLDRGVTALPIDFQDLVKSPAETLDTIFTYCDLPLSSVQRGMRAFARDSQSGTELGRKNPNAIHEQSLTEEEIASVKAILSRHPVLNNFDYVSAFGS